MNEVESAPGAHMALMLEDALPIARNLACMKARSIARQLWLTSADIEDLESQLVLKLVEAFGIFNPRVASFRTFASRVMDNKLRSVMRYEAAACRRHIAVLYDEAVEDEIKNSDTSGHGGHESSWRSLLERTDFWMDVERALGSDQELYCLAAELASKTPTELAASGKISRSTLYNRIKAIRDLFETAGIRADYFARRHRIPIQGSKCGVEDPRGL